MSISKEAFVNEILIADICIELRKKQKNVINVKIMQKTLITANFAVKVFALNALLKKHTYKMCTAMKMLVVRRHNYRLGPCIQWTALYTLTGGGSF